ncbi:hypothetical protein BC30075_4704 [Bacillus cereus]|nr:hypothetical protein BC30075_4704 [Bacillus cereus]
MKLSFHIFFLHSSQKIKVYLLFQGNGFIDILRDKRGKIMNTCDILIVIDLQNGVCYSEEHLFDLKTYLQK